MFEGYVLSVGGRPSGMSSWAKSSISTRTEPLSKKALRLFKAHELSLAIGDAAFALFQDILMPGGRFVFVGTTRALRLSKGPPTRVDGPFELVVVTNY